MMLYDIAAGWVVGTGPNKEAAIADALKRLSAQGIQMTPADIDQLLRCEDYRLMPESDDECDVVDYSQN